MTDAATTDLTAHIGHTAELTRVYRSPRDTQYRAIGTIESVDQAKGTVTLALVHTGRRRTFVIEELVKLAVWSFEPDATGYALVVDQYEWAERDTFAAEYARDIAAAQYSPAGTPTTARANGAPTVIIEPVGPLDGDPAEDRERAAEARHGGRMVTEYLASSLLGGELSEDGKRALIDGSSSMWRNTQAPAGGAYDGSGRDSLASAAQSRARGEWGRSDPSRVDMTNVTAEAMFDWPIYRAAMATTTSERVLCYATFGEHLDVPHYHD